MAEKMMQFDAFNEWQRIMENITEDLETSDILNEAFSSDYLRKFATQESGSRWQKGFAKDFYKHAGIKLDKITNEDFIILSNPNEWWTQGYAKNDKAIGFFVDDNPEFLKALKKQGKAKGSEGIGVILTIMRGNRGMWYGFAKDPGISYRYKKSPSERYGVLADEYDTARLYGWDGAKQKAKITRKNLEEVATKVYVLDIQALRDQYDATTQVTGRVDSRKGAIAMQSNKDILAAQKKRYTQILDERMDPKGMLDGVKKAMDDYTTWFGKEIAKLSFNSKKYEPNMYRKLQVDWGGWQSDYTTPIRDMMRVIESFMNSYNDYIRDQAHVDELSAKLESADDVQKAKLLGEIDYYSGSYKRFVSKAQTSRSDIKTIISRVAKITGK